MHGLTERMSSLNLLQKSALFERLFGLSLSTQLKNKDGLNRSRPEMSSLGGQGRFHFARGHFHVGLSSQGQIPLILPPEIYRLSLQKISPQRGSVLSSYKTRFGQADMLSSYSCCVDNLKKFIHRCFYSIIQKLFQHKSNLLNNLLFSFHQQIYKLQKI